MSGVHYADIYDPFGVGESCKWFVDDDGYGRWRYYEGYGQKDQEKTTFVVSINADHELWSDATDVSSPNSLQKSSTKDIGIHFSDTLSWAHNVPDESDTYQINRDSPKLVSKGVHLIDGKDRTDRVSWNFSQMLAEYVEKVGPNERQTFFHHGGNGQKWSKNKEMMQEFVKLFGEISSKLRENPMSHIALSDISVKSYPKSHFLNLEKSFTNYMTHGSTFRALAPAFVPNSTASHMPPLARQGASKICGVYAVAPVKPAGPPPPRRPTASSKDSLSFLCWDMKQELDSKMDDLDKKIDLLIAMNGPVVTAHTV